MAPTVRPFYGWGPRVAVRTPLPSDVPGQWGGWQAPVLPPAAHGTDAASIAKRPQDVPHDIGGGGPLGIHPHARASTPPRNGCSSYGVGTGSTQAQQHPTIVVTEPAAWSATGDVTTPYGFATFDVDPRCGNGPMKRSPSPTTARERRARPLCPGRHVRAPAAARAHGHG